MNGEKWVIFFLCPRRKSAAPTVPFSAGIASNGRKRAPFAPRTQGITVNGTRIACDERPVFLAANDRNRWLRGTARILRAAQENAMPENPTEIRHANGRFANGLPAARVQGTAGSDAAGPAAAGEEPPEKW
jgi:hypothetical protein